MAMSGSTDFVQSINSATTVASKEVKADAGLGRIALGPFMPILSGNYNVQFREADIAIDLPPNV
jgi:hypothetical protein